MSVLGFISEILKPVTEIIDALHTSDEEKIKLRNELGILEYNFTDKFLEFKGQELAAETQLAEARAKIIEAEAKGETFLQKSWRPLTMLSFASVVVLTWAINAVEGAEIVTFPLEFWGVLKLGLGGFVLGRSAEKISREIPKAVEAIKKLS